TNNKNLQEDIEQRMYTDLVKPFIVNDNLGIESLRVALKENAELAKATQGANIDSDAVVKEIIKKAEYLKEKYNTFTEFAPSLIKLQNENATEEDYQRYMNILTSQYLNAHSRLQFLKDKAQEKRNILQMVLSESLPGKTIDDLYSDNRLLTQDMLKNPRVNELYKDINSIETSIKENEQTVEQFWENDKTNEGFAQFVKEARELEAKIAKEKEYEDKLNEINSATDKEALDKIQLVPGDEETNEVLK